MECQTLANNAIDTALGIVCFYTLLLGGATISPGVTYGGLIVGLGASVNYLNTGAALMILFLGLGNLILTPLVNIPNQDIFS